jgi:hydrogenase maturation protease
MLVIGLGNTLLTDEGVGVHLVKALSNMPMPPGVQLMEGETAGVDLLSDIMDSDRVVIIDAAMMGLAPGSVHSFTSDDLNPTSNFMASLHDMALPEVLKLGTILSQLPPILIIGVEPKTVEPGVELSADVKGSMPGLIKYCYQAILDFSKEVVN